MIHLLQSYMVISQIILCLTQLYIYAVIIYCILSMCIYSDILRHPLIVKIYYFFARLVEPALRPLRAILPDLGSFDYAPLILILILNYAIPFCLKELFKMIWAAMGQF